MQPGATRARKNARKKKREICPARHRWAVASQQNFTGAFTVQQ